MSVLKVANVHFESTGANRIDLPSSNQLEIYVGGNLILRANTQNNITIPGNLTVSGTFSGRAGSINVQTFNASGTWTKPTGYDSNSRVLVQLWGAGGSGARSSDLSNERLKPSGGGGGGGGYGEYWTNLSSLGSTETITIGAGGASRTTANVIGLAGGNTVFGLLTVSGGGGGGNTNGAVNLANTAYGGGIVYQNQGGIGPFSQPTGGYLNDSGCTVNFTNPAPGLQNGGGGGRGLTLILADLNFYTSGNGAGSVYGGGGGGGKNPTNYANSGIGGVSIFGGRGGNGATSWITAGSAGTAPGGGGGGCAANNVSATSGAGGDGRAIITVFPA